MRGWGGVKIDGDELPAVVDQIAIRPVWQLSDEEERRTKQVEVNFETRPTADMPVAEDRESRLARHGVTRTQNKDVLKSRANDQFTRLSELLDNCRETIVGIARLDRAVAGSAMPSSRGMVSLL